jgi:hypothetical protein
MSILGSIALAAVGTLVPGAGIAIAIWKKFGKDEVLGGLKKGASWLFLHPMALVAIAAVIFGLYERHGRHSAEAKIPALQQRAANSHTAFLLEKKAFATEKASLDTALGHIADNNKRILAQAADLDQAKRDDAANIARNGKLAQSTDARIARLKAISADVHRAPCTLSDEAKKGLDGL